MCFLQLGYSPSSFFLPPTVPLTPPILHLAGVNHLTLAHLCPHSSLSLPFCLYRLWLLHSAVVQNQTLSLSVCLCHSSVSWCIWQTCTVERQQTSNGRSVWAGVCVCVLCGGGCAHLHVCAHAQMTKATVRLRQLNPIWEYFHTSFRFCTDTEPTPTKPLTLESLSCPTRTAELSQYAPTCTLYHGHTLHFKSLQRSLVVREAVTWFDPLNRKCIHLPWQQPDRIIQEWVCLRQRDCNNFHNGL